MRVRGRLTLGRTVVSAATLTAADGLMVLGASSTTSGAWVEVESGATVRGIQIINKNDDDITDVWGSECTQLVLVASPVAPWSFTLENEAADLPSIAEMHRLWCPSQGTPGTFANATVWQNQITLAWDPSLSRWRVPWSAA